MDFICRISSMLNWLLTGSLRNANNEPTSVKLKQRKRSAELAEI